MPVGDLLEAFHLSGWRAAAMATLFGISFISNFVHWGIVVRASRLREESGLEERLLPYGFGDWHLGMLLRSWYPTEAKRLYVWALVSYVVAMAALLVAGVLLIVWFAI
jgi:hypothetical protein